MTLFLATFATLLAIINPLEALPVFLELVGGKGQQEQLDVARRARLYAMALMFFFLIFGTLILRIFGISLDMVRIVGGIILTRLGFTLSSSKPMASTKDQRTGGPATAEDDPAFVPLAMPIMFGPGAIATILGMTSTVRQSDFEVAAFVAITGAIVATMAVTYLVLRAAPRLLLRIGPRGLDAGTRIVGFFVSAMGMGLVFHGIVGALHTYGLTNGH